jgi:hypothetical protein
LKVSTGAGVGRGEEVGRAPDVAVAVVVPRVAAITTSDKPHTQAYRSKPST